MWSPRRALHSDDSRGGGFKKTGGGGRRGSGVKWSEGWMQNGFGQLRLLIKRARWLKEKGVRGLGSSQRRWWWVSSWDRRRTLLQKTSYQRQRRAHWARPRRDLMLPNTGDSLWSDRWKLPGRERSLEYFHPCALTQHACKSFLSLSLLCLWSGVHVQNANTPRDGTPALVW